MTLSRLLLSFLIVLWILPGRVAVADSECAILLHGLGRTASSMRPIEQALTQSGYRTWNKSYPSTEQDVATLTRSAIEPAIRFCANASRIHFVTHSLGGVLVRNYLRGHTLTGRVVMLSPPNRGSELPDLMRKLPGAGYLLGPASLELGTDPTSAPNELGPPSSSLADSIGVIMGNRSSDPWFSPLIPGPDDGKVSVASARLSATGPFIEVPYGHTFLMKYRPVIGLVLQFLKTGSFAARPHNQGATLQPD